jgi:oxalate decarboxylase/phosphoglucose isomerase-like protein (cupin superfamily)
MRRDMREMGHRVIECVQLPGEVIFIPHGWIHAVLNLELSVAWTQNFASPANALAVRDALPPVSANRFAEAIQ